MCLVYDSTNALTFDALKFWENELQEQNGLNGVVMAVIASKVDDTDREQVSIK